MPGPRIFGLSILAVGLAAGSCEPQDPAAKLCQADIRSWLARPDTARFLEFERISQQEWEDGLVDATTYFVKAEPHYGEFLAQTRDRARSEGLSLVASGASFHRYAYSSEDGSGNRTTSSQYCAVNTIACSCVSRDEVEAMRASLRQ